MLLEVSQISKSFSTKLALNKVSLSISKGEIVGIVGPNGSGKTTLLNILMGMIKPTSGTFYTDRNVKIGMSVSRKGFFDDMSVKNNILLHSRLLNLKDDDTILVMNNFLIDFQEKQFGSLSAGMKQRVSLVLPFLSNYEIILLDEPTNHLDIDSIILLRASILGLKKTGSTFILTSHVFSDLEKVCDRIIFMKNGEVVSCDSTDKLLSEYGNLESAYIKILK